MDWYDAKVVKPPKFKKIVLSYDSHAKHFVDMEKKKAIDTTPEKVFEGYSSRKSSKDKVRKSSQKTKTTLKKKSKNKK